MAQKQPLWSKKGERRLARIVRTRLKSLGVPVHFVLVLLIVRLALEVLSEQLPPTIEKIIKTRRFEPRIDDAGMADKIARGLRMWRYIFRTRKYRNRSALTNKETAAMFQLLSEARARRNADAVSAIRKSIEYLETGRE